MKQNRREFLIKSGCALSMTALATQIQAFRFDERDWRKKPTMKRNNANAPDDYRALVCIFLVGGNDGNNTVIPLHTDANLSNYRYIMLCEIRRVWLSRRMLCCRLPVPRMSNLTLRFSSELRRRRIRQQRHSRALDAGQNGGCHQCRNARRADDSERSFIRSVRIRNLTICFRIPIRRHSIKPDAATGRFLTAGAADFPIGAHLLDNPGASIPMITSVAGAQLFHRRTDDRAARDRRRADRIE